MLCPLCCTCIKCDDAAVLYLFCFFFQLHLPLPFYTFYMSSCRMACTSSVLHCHFQNWDTFYFSSSNTFRIKASYSPSYGHHETTDAPATVRKLAIVGNCLTLMVCRLHSQKKTDFSEFSGYFPNALWIWKCQIPIPYTTASVLLPWFPALMC